MMRVVLDANIFISAVLKPHSELAKIFILFEEEKIRLVLSKQILAEVGRVLLYPKLKKRHKQTPKEIDRFLRNTAKNSDLVAGRTKICEIKDDPADNKYLSAALEGKADFIVSGDHHLKALEIFQGIRILPPAAFLELIAKLI